MVPACHPRRLHRSVDCCTVHGYLLLNVGLVGACQEYADIGLASMPLCQQAPDGTRRPLRHHLGQRCCRCLGLVRIRHHERPDSLLASVFIITMTTITLLHVEHALSNSTSIKKKAPYPLI
jgi:hypothetical protein